jgi:hypothetical protein
MIAVTLELSHIPSLAFAVGVYLPLSASSPIFVGGLVRWAVDKYLARKPENQGLSEAEMVAETDKSQGVLLASGYIAGATLAGVLYAFLNLNEGIVARLVGFEQWAAANNPFYQGPYADLLGLLPLTVITIVLYLVGREIIGKPRRA